MPPGKNSLNSAAVLPLRRDVCAQAITSSLVCEIVHCRHQHAKQLRNSLCSGFLAGFARVSSSFLCRDMSETHRRIDFAPKELNAPETTPAETTTAEPATTTSPTTIATEKETSAPQSTPTTVPLTTVSSCSVHRSELYTNV